MNVLYLDCSMGAAGDMLTAALLELLPDSDKFTEELNSLAVPGVKYTKEKSVKCGIAGTHISVTVNGAEESEKFFSHTHNEKHHHRTIKDIEQIIFSLSLPKKVQDDVFEVYKLIADAESQVHGANVSEIHFHEVGAMDAIADIIAVCMLINRLAPDEIVVSPINVGSGYVKCAHGLLSVPAPATACILKNIPIYGSEIKSELCTPTGAALLAHFATQFGSMPIMKISAIGYGMGKKDFHTPNCVRAMIGETENKTDTVCELSCNVDDMTAEEISFAADRLFEAGAYDVYTVPIGMKKSRPGTLIRVICNEQEKDTILRLLFKHIATLGVRETVMHRYVLDRSIKTLNTPYGNVRVKASSGYGVSRYKYEYDDIARIAKEQNISIEEIEKLIDNCR